MSDLQLLYDFVLTNGTVVDPASNLHAQRHVAIRFGRIAGILEPDATFSARQTIDCTGCLVVPGLIDFHVHVFPCISHFGIDPDETCLARGVTTVLDFGSAGGLTFDGFRRFVIDTAKTRVKGLMHIAGQGMMSGLETRPAIGELWDLSYCDVDGCVRAVERHRDHVVGIKVRCMDNISRDGAHEREALDRARVAADESKLPLVIHPVLSTLPIDHLFGQLGAGDVMTHCYHDKRCGLVDRDLRVLSIVREKLAEGVKLDVGHGAGSFGFRVARSMLNQDILPDFIGSDLHIYNLYGPVFDLPSTMDKFLHLGMSVPEIIRRTTINCAEFLGLADEIGSLRAGSCADVTVLEIQEGEFPMTDSEGNTELAQRRFEVRHCFRAGRRVGLLPRPDGILGVDRVGER